MSANTPEPKKINTTIGDLFGKYALHVRRKVVSALLAGNDTQCFTTEAYKAEYERQQPMPASSARPGLYWRLDPSGDLAKKHLRSTGMVEEVSPGVWKMKEEAARDHA